MIPGSEEEKIQWIERNLIPLFDSQLSSIPDSELDDEKIKRSKQILAEEYLKEGSGFFKNLVKLSVPLMLIDYFTGMPLQVYGLVFSITGTMIMLVEADILGSKSIAARSERVQGGVYGSVSYLDEQKARRLAQNTVSTNIGLVWLVFGFALQVIAVWVV